MVATILALGLSACGSRADDNAAASDEPLTTKEIASRADGFVKPEPGLYRSTMAILEVDIPNAPPQARDMMKNSFSSSKPQEYCVTPQDVEKGFEEAIRKSQQGACDYKKFDVDGGKIEAVLTCTQEGQTMDMTLSGTGTSTTSDMVMTMRMDMPGVGKSTIRARSKSERIGDCPA